MTIDELDARISAVEAAAEMESRAVSQTFREMRTFVAASVGGLRRDMNRRFDGVDKRLDKLEKRFDGLEQRFDKLEQRFDGLDQRFDGLEQRFSRVESKLDRVLETRPRRARKARRRR